MSEHGGRWRRVAVGVVAACCAVPAAPAQAQFVAKTSAQKQAAIADALTDFVPIAEQYYCTAAGPNHANCTDARSAPGLSLGKPFYAAWWGAPAGGVTQARGASAVAYDLATLLEASAASTFVGKNGPIARADLIDHIESTIHWLALSNDLHDSGTGSATDEWWGGAECFDAHCTDVAVTSQLGMAAQLLWGDLSPTVRDAVREVIESEADILAARAPGVMTSDTDGSSDGEENSWAAAALAMASAFFPGENPSGSWAQAAKKFAIHASTTRADETSNVLIDGTALSAWYEGRNLEDDLTLINHGFFHPVYSWAALGDVAQAKMFYEMVSATQPQAFDFRAEEIWDAVLGPLSWNDGDLIGPAGTDWTTHDYGHVGYLAGVATMQQDAAASVLEWRAIEQFAARMAVVADDDDLGWAADQFRYLSQAWWMHELFGTAPVPTESQFDAARATTDGVHIYEDEATVVGRMGEAFLSMSWDYDSGDTSPTALVVPSSEDHLSDPVFAQPGAGSGVGATDGGGTTFDVHTRMEDDQYFSTAAVIDQTAFDDRRFSMTGFDDGVALLLEEGSNDTFLFKFEDVDDFVPERTVYSDSGTGTLGNLSGWWVNVSNRFGLIAKGGVGPSAGKTGGSNPHLWVRGARATGTGGRVAMVMPNVTSTTTDNLEPDVKELPTSAAGWEAMQAVAPDGTGRVAFARWAGSGSSTISGMSSTLGVPIPDTPTAVTVTAASGSTTASLGTDKPHSVGHRAYWYATSAASKTATVTPITETHVKVVNGGSSNLVTLKYDAGPGAVQTTSLTLAANEIAYGFVYGGTLVFVRVSASSASGSQPATLAFDGSSSTYWSSASTTLSSPVCITLDLGQAATVGRLLMTPRTGFGPKNYSVYTRTSSPTGTCDTSGWGAAKATVTNAGDGVFQNPSWVPASARYIRVLVTAAYGSSPFSVGVREVGVASS
jgi:hypothetical protein